MTRFLSLEMSISHSRDYRRERDGRDMDQNCAGGIRCYRKSSGLLSVVRRSEVGDDIDDDDDDNDDDDDDDDNEGEVLQLRESHPPPGGGLPQAAPAQEMPSLQGKAHVYNILCLLFHFINSFLSVRESLDSRLPSS